MQMERGGGGVGAAGLKWGKSQARDGKLAHNFSHESDVTSLQDLCT